MRQYCSAASSLWQIPNQAASGENLQACHSTDKCSFEITRRAIILYLPNDHAFRLSFRLVAVWVMAANNTYPILLRRQRSTVEGRKVFVLNNSIVVEWKVVPYKELFTQSNSVPFFSPPKEQWRPGATLSIPRGLDPPHVYNQISIKPTLTNPGKPTSRTRSALSKSRYILTAPGELRDDLFSSSMTSHSRDVSPRCFLKHHLQTLPPRKIGSSLVEHTTSRRGRLCSVNATETKRPKKASLHQMVAPPWPQRML